MRFYTFVLGLLFVSVAGAESKQFGKAFTETKAIGVKEAIAAFVPDKPVVVQAKVTKVCQKKGCWMQLKSAEKDVRVTFENYGFFVPASLENKTVLVKGRLVEHKMSVREAKHYAEDAGEDSSKVTEAKKEYRIVASGVKLL